MKNPFYYGAPVNSDYFTERNIFLQKEILPALVGGVSIALTGEHKVGKTSLLRYLVTSQQYRQYLRQETQTEFVFNYIDSQILKPDTFLEKLYETIILELIERKITDVPFPNLLSREDLRRFASRVLIDLEKKNTKLVLLIDDFDTIFHYPKAKKKEIFNFLKEVSKNYQSTSLVVAIEHNSFNAHIKDNPNGFMNMLKVVNLKMFSEVESRKLLTLGKERFDENDNIFLLNTTGGHPYLLQTAASTLWESYESKGQDQDKRQQLVLEILRDRTSHFFHSIWTSWPSGYQAALILMSIIGGKEHSTKAQIGIDHITFSGGYETALRELSLRGYLIKDNESLTGYRISISMLDQWMRAQLFQYETAKGFLTTEDKEILTPRVREKLYDYLRNSNKSNLPVFFSERFEVLLSSRFAGDSTTDAPPPFKTKTKGK